MLAFAADFFSRPVGVSVSTALMWGWFTCLTDSFAGRLLSGFFFAIALPMAVIRLRWFIETGGDHPRDDGTLIDLDPVEPTNPIQYRYSRLALSSLVWFLTMFGVIDAFARAIGRP